MNTIRIQIARTSSTTTIAQGVALALLSEQGLMAAAKDQSRDVWSVYRDQAIAIQTEIVGNTDEAKAARKAEMAKFGQEVEDDIQSAALANIAHGLGLDKFTTDTAKKSPKENTAVLVSRAKKKNDQYLSRILGAWELDVLLSPGISTGKLEDLKKQRREAVEAAKQAKDGLPIHVQLKREAATLADNVAQVVGDTGSGSLEAAEMHAINGYLHRVRQLVVRVAQKGISVEQVEELALELELVLEQAADKAEPAQEAPQLANIPAEGGEEQPVEAREAAAA